MSNKRRPAKTHEDDDDRGGACISELRSLSGKVFRCHYCVVLIGEDCAVYMRRDASYCSPECRRKGPSATSAQQTDREVASLATLSSYSSDTASSSDTGSKVGIGRGEKLFNGLLGWVVRKFLGASEGVQNLGLASSSFGSLGDMSLRGAFARIIGACLWGTASGCGWVWSKVFVESSLFLLLHGFCGTLLNTIWHSICHQLARHGI